MIFAAAVKNIILCKSRFWAMTLINLFKKKKQKKGLIFVIFHLFTSSNLTFYINEMTDFSNWYLFYILKVFSDYKYIYLEIWKYAMNIEKITYESPRKIIMNVLLYFFQSVSIMCMS